MKAENEEVRMEKMDGKTMDILAENVVKLKELFPEAFTEDKIDFDALKEVLGEYVDDGNERYSFTWNGKIKARMIAQTPSTGTLRPCKEESVDWDTTQNIFIEGDNLEVLKLLQKSYHKKVKMIYIDPPYNTGKDFVYKDNFKDNIKNYKEITGQVDGEGRNLSSNPETSGRYHTDWLNMMYPRLKLARNLLKDDGVIFISIDEIEVSKLRIICDEVFGEENHIADFVWQNKKGGGNDAKYVAVEHEYVIMYARDEISLHNLFEPYKPEYLKRYKEQDEIGKFFWDTFKRKSGKQYYPITAPDGAILEIDENGNPISWLRSQGRFQRDLKDGEVRFVGGYGKWSIHFKQRLPQGKKPRSIFLSDSIWDDVGTATNGTKEIQEIFNIEVPAIFLYSPTYTYTQSRDLKGFSGNILISPENRFNSVSDWYLKTKLKIISLKR
jgi:adenine-specific DNA-methyltransferase